MQLLIFDKQEKLKTILKNSGAACPFYDAIHEEELNGKNTFIFSVPADHIDAQYVAEGCGVAFKDLDGNYQYFEIKTIEEEHNANGLLKVASCESGLYELLDEFIVDKRLTDVSLIFAIMQALMGTRWTLVVAEPTETNSIDYIRINPLSAIYKALDLWGGELDTSYTITDTSITSRNLFIRSQRGNNTGKRFEYTKDLTRVKRTVDTTNIKTALYGYGKASETTDGLGQRLTFKDLDMNYPPFNKPAGQEWVGIDSVKAVWGRDNGTRHRFGVVDYPDVTSKTWLLTKTLNDLVKSFGPVITYEASVIDLETIAGLDHEKVRLGDTATIIDKEFSTPLVVQVRVISIKRNLLKPEETDIILGNFKPSLSKDVNRLDMLEQKVNDKSGQWDDKLSPNSNAYINASGVGDLSDTANPVLSAGGIKTNATNFYIGQSGEVRVTDEAGYNGGGTITYKPIRASSFPTGSSVQYKTNIEEFIENAIDIVKDTRIYRYHLKSNVEMGIYDKPKVGMLAEIVPQLIKDEDGVDTYSIVSILWKAVQEQQRIIEELKTFLGIS